MGLDASERLELLVVGASYSGSTVVKIDEERSERPNGMTRIRRAIHLASGMILVEDEFKDNRRTEGEYKELEYPNIPSPDLSIKPSPRSKKKKKETKKKLKSPTQQKDDGDDDQEERQTKEKQKEIEDNARQEREEAERKENEERELKLAQELEMQKEKELQAKREMEEKAEAEERDRKQREKEEAEREAERLRKEAADERLRQSQEAALRKSQEAALRRKEEADARRAEKQKKAAAMEKWNSKTMWVHSPESRIPRKDEDGRNKDAAPEAIWSYGGGSEPDESFDCWKPKQIVVYPPGKDPKFHSENEEVPHGLWIYAEGARPDDDDDDDWFPSGGPPSPAVVVFPPGVTPSAIDGQELKPDGTWSYPVNDRTDFPPLPSPKDEWGVQPVTVHPKANSIVSNAGDSIQGQWMTHDGKKTRPVDDDKWRVMEVQAYPDGKVPPDADVTGVWGVPIGAKPDEKGQWNPSDLWFFGPGEATPEDDAWNPQGVWTYSPEETRIDWPPLSEPRDEWEPQPVWVCPQSSLNEDNDEEWKPSGTWSFNADNVPEDAEDWAPCQVMVYPTGKEPENLEDAKVHGVWGLSPTATREDDEDWKPSDILFVGPGDEPPPDWKPQGVWTLSPPGNQSDDSAEDWPPKRKVAQVETTTAPDAPANNETTLSLEKAWIYPRKKAPKAIEDGTKAGVWASIPGKKAKDSGKKPILVDLYEKGQEEQQGDSSELGVWGYAPNAEPSSTGHYLPSDMWFFAPGDKPPDDDAWQPRGTWSDPSSQPKKSGKASKSGRKSKKTSPKKSLLEPPPPALDDQESDPDHIWRSPLEAGYNPGPKQKQPNPTAPDSPTSEKGVQVVTVHPKSKLPARSEGDSILGQWMTHDGKKTRPVDDGKWRVTEVQAYPDDKVPPEAKVSGVWGVPIGAKPDEKGQWNPSDLWFFGPGEATPEDDAWNPQGVWTYSPEETRIDWPPLSEPRDEWEPQPVWVCPASSKPSNESDEEWKSSGTWSFGTDTPLEDAEDWAPCQIMVYPTGKEPEDIEDAKVHGVWGLSPTATRDDDEDWKPSDILFVPPGEEPPVDWKPQGWWTLSAPGNQSDDSAEDWPPRRKVAKEEPSDMKSWASNSTISTTLPPDAPNNDVMEPSSKKAWIYPRKKAPKAVEDDTDAGVWSYTPGKKVMDSGKKPILVDLYEKGQEPKGDTSELGVWGYAPNAEPTSTGHYLPSDMWFFAPGEKPPDDDTWQPRGTWSDPSSLPKSKKLTTKKPQQVEQPLGLEHEETPKATPKKKFQRKFEDSVLVYPSKDKAPKKGEKANRQGCWSNLSCSSHGDEHTEILVHPKGHKPKDAKKRPHGSFGYAPGSQPDEDGLWSPQDMIFFPPGEDPPPGIQNEGVWSYPHEARIEIESSYTFEGNDIVNVKKTTMFYMDMSITFIKEYRE